MTLLHTQDPLQPQPADADKPEQQWQAGSLYGAALLQALIADDQPQSLQAWATAAPAVLDAISEAQAACSSSEGKLVPSCVALWQASFAHAVLLALLKVMPVEA